MSEDDKDRIGTSPFQRRVQTLSNTLKDGPIIEKDNTGKYGLVDDFQRGLDAADTPSGPSVKISSSADFRAGNVEQRDFVQQLIILFGVRRPHSDNWMEVNDIGEVATSLNPEARKNGPGDDSQTSFVVNNHSGRPTLLALQFPNDPGVKMLFESEDLANENEPLQLSLLIDTN
ncbi:hypothetical protein ACFL2C_01715 [Patescibacteria group bacterium]